MRDQTTEGHLRMLEVLFVMHERNASRRYREERKYGYALTHECEHVKTFDVGGES